MTGWASQLRSQAIRTARTRRPGVRPHPLEPDPARKLFPEKLARLGSIARQAAETSEECRVCITALFLVPVRDNLTRLCTRLGVHGRSEAFSDLFEGMQCFENAVAGRA